MEGRNVENGRRIYECKESEMKMKMTRCIFIHSKEMKKNNNKSDVKVGKM